MLVCRQCFFLGGVENLFQQEQKDQRRILRREALNIVEAGTQDMSTCAWDYRLQLSSRLFVNFRMDMLDLFVNLFCSIVCKFGWIFCIAQVGIPVCAGSRQHHLWSSFPQMQKVTLLRRATWLSAWLHSHSLSATSSIHLVFIRSISSAKWSDMFQFAQ